MYSLANGWAYIGGGGGLKPGGFKVGFGGICNKKLAVRVLLKY